MGAWCEEAAADAGPAAKALSKLAESKESETAVQVPGSAVPAAVLINSPVIEYPPVFPEVTGDLP